MVDEVIAGRYEIRELVGSGGMSSVFLAYDRLLERKVAIKMLHSELGEDEDYVERFRKEARAVAQLSHPNIVTVIDRGEQDGRQFIVFEYVEGENLKDLVEREGPLPVREALVIALQVGRGLAFAHGHGLIHRDVKPHNVLLDGDGRVKVTDFGIARSLDVDDATTTAVGGIFGTSHYIAPEQAKGAPIDEKTDVYSFGTVLYELLTAEVPFPGDSFVVVAMRHVNDPVPHVREVRPEVPERLDAAVARAMAKDPADRFESMDAFCAELDASLRDVHAEGGETMVIRQPDTKTQVQPRARRRRRWPFVLVPLLLLAIAGAGAAAYFFRDRGFSLTPGPPPPPRVAHLAAIGAYDPPPGDGQEHNDEVKYAADGDPATYWETEHYRGGLGAKPGVGLVLDAGKKARLHALLVTTDTPGFDFEILGGSSRTGPFPLHIGSPRTASTTTTRLVMGKNVPTARYYVIWITNLGGNPSVHVNEVVPG